QAEGGVSPPRPRWPRLRRPDAHRLERLAAGAYRLGRWGAVSRRQRVHPRRLSGACREIPAILPAGVRLEHPGVQAEDREGEAEGVGKAGGEPQVEGTAHGRGKEGTLLPNRVIDPVG